MSNEKVDTENVSTIEYQSEIARMHAAEPLSAEDPGFYDSKARLRKGFPHAHMFRMLPGTSGGTHILMVENRGVFQTVVR